MTACSLGLMWGCRSGLDDPGRIPIRDYTDTMSYIIGQDYGQGVRDQDIRVNLQAIYRGFHDGLNDTSLIPDSLKQALINHFNEELDLRRKKEEEQMVRKNLEDSRVFLEKNRQQEGVRELPSGLQYLVLKEGQGDHPGMNDSVIIHYRAMFVDRRTFDMSYDRGPAGIKLNEVIPGLSEGIMLMKPGAIYELYIPPALGYGDQNFANIVPGGSTLIYTIELIRIVK
ncbi:MAG: FKBP-type peptidyl-prolyl cis-trans isomerase [Bacteroidales bacterium]|nr:FKBP-type peptidyl-prolyl cis-trans isomerase [Bacteroidales bacterium]